MSFFKLITNNVFRSARTYGSYFLSSVFSVFVFFIFFGEAPVDFPPCIRQRPLAIALFLHGFPLLVLAPQKFAWGLFCIYIAPTSIYTK